MVDLRATVSVMPTPLEQLVSLDQRYHDNTVLTHRWHFYLYRIWRDYLNTECVFESSTIRVSVSPTLTPTQTQALTLTPTLSLTQTKTLTLTPHLTLTPTLTLALTPILISAIMYPRLFSNRENYNTYYLRMNRCCTEENMSIF